MAVMASLPQRERERRLVEAARDDPVAFGALYEQHVDAIYAYALHRVRDGTVAEDVVAETFHRALENLGRYEWRGVPFSAWLYRIASNVIAARYRHEPAVHLDDIDHLHHDGLGPLFASVYAGATDHYREELREWRETSDLTSVGTLRTAQ